MSTFKIVFEEKNKIDVLLVFKISIVVMNHFEITLFNHPRNDDSMKLMFFSWKSSKSATTFRCLVYEFFYSQSKTNINGLTTFAMLCI